MATGFKERYRTPGIARRGERRAGGGRRTIGVPAVRQIRRQILPAAAEAARSVRASSAPVFVLSRRPRTVRPLPATTAAGTRPDTPAPPAEGGGSPTAPPK